VIKSVSKSLVLLLTFYSLNSCNSISRLTETKKQLSLRQQGYDPIHSSACGPYAIRGLLKDLKINTTLETKDISKKILNNSQKGNELRQFLGLFSKNASKITWPSELENTLQNYLENTPYRVRKISEPKDMNLYLNDLKEGKRKGIILTRKKFGIKYHYSPMPLEAILYDPEQNELIEIYLVEEK